MRHSVGVRRASPRGIGLVLLLALSISTLAIEAEGARLRKGTVTRTSPGQSEGWWISASDTILITPDTDTIVVLTEGQNIVLPEQPFDLITEVTSVRLYRGSNDRPSVAAVTPAPYWGYLLLDELEPFVDPSSVEPYEPAMTIFPDLDPGNAYRLVIDYEVESGLYETVAVGYEVLDMGDALLDMPRIIFGTPGYSNGNWQGTSVELSARAFAADWDGDGRSVPVVIRRSGFGDLRHYIADGLHDNAPFESGWTWDEAMTSSAVGFIGPVLQEVMTDRIAYDPYDHRWFVASTATGEITTSGALNQETGSWLSLLADVTGDGRLELVNVEEDLGVVVARSAADFQEVLRYTIPSVDSQIVDVEAGDWDGDGLDEIAVLQQSDPRTFVDEDGNALGTLLYSYYDARVASWATSAIPNSSGGPESLDIIDILDDDVGSSSELLDVAYVDMRGAGEPDRCRLHYWGAWYVEYGAGFQLPALSGVSTVTGADLDGDTENGSYTATVCVDLGTPVVDVTFEARGRLFGVDEPDWVEVGSEIGYIVAGGCTEVIFEGEPGSVALGDPLEVQAVVDDGLTISTVAVGSLSSTNLELTPEYEGEIPPGFDLDPASAELDLWATVEFSGAANVDRPVTVEWYLEGVEPTIARQVLQPPFSDGPMHLDTLVDLRYVEGIEAGQSYDLSVVVDPEDRVDEWAEADNSLEFFNSVPLAAVDPNVVDLVVSSRPTRQGFEHAGDVGYDERDYWDSWSGPFSDPYLEMDTINLSPDLGPATTQQAFPLDLSSGEAWTLTLDARFMFTEHYTQEVNQGYQFYVAVHDGTYLVNLGMGENKLRVPGGGTYITNTTTRRTYEIIHWGGGNVTILVGGPEVAFDGVVSPSPGSNVALTFGDGTGADNAQVRIYGLRWERTSPIATGAPVSPTVLAPIVRSVQPNPFNPLTTFQLRMPEAARVRLTIHDLAGRLVRTLMTDELLDVGEHSLSWDGRDHSGAPVASGAYLYRLESAVGSSRGKLALVR